MTFSDGIIEGSRALSRLVKKLRIKDQKINFDELRDLIIETGKDSVLEDDQMIILVRTAAAD